MPDTFKEATFNETFWGHQQCQDLVILMVVWSLNRQSISADTPRRYH
jgi:hypothetical protein